MFGGGFLVPSLPHWCRMRRFLLCWSWNLIVFEKHYVQLVCMSWLVISFWWTIVRMVSNISSSSELQFMRTSRLHRTYSLATPREWKPSNTLFSSRAIMTCFKSCSVKSLHERSKELRREHGSARMLASALADSLPMEFADKFKSMIVLLPWSPSSRTRPPSSTNLFRRRLRLTRESFPRRARPRYRPP